MGRPAKTFKKSRENRKKEVNKLKMTDQQTEAEKNAVSPAYACDETTKDGFIRVIVAVKNLTVSRQFKIKNMKFVKVPENATIPAPEFSDRGLLLRVEGKQKGALKGKLFILNIKQLPFEINPDKSYHKPEEDRVLLFLSKKQDKSWYPELEAGLETAEEDDEEEAEN